VRLASAAAALSHEKNRNNTARGSNRRHEPSQGARRGYSIVSKDGGIIKDASDTKPGDRLKIRLSKGSIGCKVLAPDES
jgi:exonuclease VII large subunit